MRAPTCSHTVQHLWPSPPLCTSPSSSRQINFPRRPPRRLRFSTTTGLDLFGIRNQFARVSYGEIKATVNGGERSYSSPWDEKPYEILPNGKKAYLDEQDIVTFIDPPNELIPLDPTSYNPAAFLWKKIDDIPEERRHRLLHLLEPRLISRAWEIAGTRYEDPKLAKKSASNLFSSEDGVMPLEFYNCRTSGGPLPIAWMKFFKKALFCCKDGKTYGRFIGGSVLDGLASSYSPLYFMVRQTREVMPTEQPCDLAYEFGDGLMDLREYPEGFPRPGKHPYPFNDQVVIYVRHVGPGVSVGQAWQEGKALEQVPQKLCSEILMVKDYAAFRENH